MIGQIHTHDTEKGQAVIPGNRLNLPIPTRKKMIQREVRTLKGLLKALFTGGSPVEIITEEVEEPAVTYWRHPLGIFSQPLKSPEYHIPKFPLENIGYQLHPHQEEGARFLLYKGNAMLLHSPGSGKTVTTLAALLTELKARPRNVLVVCPAKMVPAWEERFQKHAIPGEVWSFNKFGRDRPDPVPGTRVIIDEAHWLKGQGAWYEAFVPYAEDPTIQFWMLTATPILTNADLRYVAALLERGEYLWGLKGEIRYVGDPDRIDGVDPETLKVVWARTHVYYETSLFNRIRMEYFYRGDTVDLVKALLEAGRKVLVYVRKVDDGQGLAWVFGPENVNLIARSYSPPDSTKPLTIMTHQMGEGVNLQGLADTIVYHDLPYGLAEYLQTAFRSVRIDSDDVVDIFIRASDEHTRIYGRYRSQKNLYESHETGFFRYYLRNLR